MSIGVSNEHLISITAKINSWSPQNLSISLPHRSKLYSQLLNCSKQKFRSYPWSLLLLIPYIPTFTSILKKKKNPWFFIRFLSPYYYPTYSDSSPGQQKHWNWLCCFPSHHSDNALSTQQPEWYFGKCKSDHVTPLTKTIQWFPIHTPSLRADKSLPNTALPCLAIQHHLMPTPFQPPQAPLSLSFSFSTASAWNALPLFFAWQLLCVTIIP